MSDPRAAAEAVLAELTDTFLASTADRLEQLEAAAMALDAGQLDGTLRQQAEQAAHRLAGAAGIFGFAAASRRARELEQQLRRATPSAPAQGRRLRSRVAALRAALHSPDGGGTRPAPEGRGQATPSG